MAQKIIVSGGAGYIGSHTAVALQNAGFDVAVFDNLLNSSADSLDGVARITGVRPQFEKVDCTDTAALRDAFSRHRDAVGVIHFAALKAVGESTEKPLMYYQNNLGGLINVLNAMNDFKIKNIVFSSSATVYGVPEKLPATEETPLQPATCTLWAATSSPLGIPVSTPVSSPCWPISSPPLWQVWPVSS